MRRASFGSRTPRRWSGCVKARRESSSSSRSANDRPTRLQRAERVVSTLPPPFVARAIAIVGAAHSRRDQPALERYGADALKLGHPADLVVLPGSTAEVASLARLCHEARIPLVVRGGGTGYTGGAVPTQGGVVASLERLDRILEIDRDNLLARVQPNVITGALQETV